MHLHQFQNLKQISLVHQETITQVEQIQNYEQKLTDHEQILYIIDSTYPEIDEISREIDELFHEENQI